MALDIHINCQLSKQETRLPVSRDHIAGWDVVSESRKMALKENIQVNYNFAIWYERSISWSIDSCQNKVSADHYHITVSRVKV